VTREVFAVPTWLKPSATTDIAQFVLRIRPAFRTQLHYHVDLSAIRRWAWSIGGFAATDAAQYLVVSRRSDQTRRLLMLDARPDDHTYSLGRALGYPHCCCRAAAKVGESNLDHWRDEQIAKGFRGKFKGINPSGYLRGDALISHIPCGNCCVPSLRMAITLQDALSRKVHLFRRL
jgi:hypothetical protein